MNIDGGRGWPTGDAYSSRAPGPTPSLLVVRPCLIWCSIQCQIHIKYFTGNRTSLSNFPIHFLMSNTDEYMTYEGSLTQPGCQESVTWIILNTPVFVTEEQLKVFQNEASMEWHKNNARPLQSLNHRVIRTNIHHRSKVGYLFDVCFILLVISIGISFC
ncbi:hypothetical protein FSP39_004123 [Pinctada imbricata]|uniref:Alpha-carbonic anhydrase domain-containing protein n=1 Tax=Pinctada imbricata TaxID=66713 RepID=A0AA89BWU7_PINIB|nr:hypothetical protein FSP39_004123 [Pinctada imbricata]